MTTDLTRYQAPGALARKKPATARPTAPVRQYPRARMVAQRVHYHALLAEAKRLERAGRVRLCQDKPVWHAERGQWELTVEQLKEPMPRWAKWCIGTGIVLALLSAFGLAGLWLFATLAAAPGALLLTLVLAVFVAGSLLGQRRGSRGVVEVLVSVLVRVR